MTALVTGLALVLIVGLALVLGELLIGASRRAMAEETEYDVDPAGLALACLGAAAIAAGVFLPLDQPGGRIAYVQSNTLVQHGGWVLIVLGVGVALDAYRCYQAGKRSWGVLALGIVGLVVVVVFAESRSLRTLYPVSPGGDTAQSAPGTVVPLGIAVYVSGLGAVLAVVGGWIMRQRSVIREVADTDASLDPEATKRCPDCAETILEDARVCKHCGCRFDADARVAQRTEGEA